MQNTIVEKPLQLLRQFSDLFNQYLKDKENIEKDYEIKIQSQNRLIDIAYDEHNKKYNIEKVSYQEKVNAEDSKLQQAQLTHKNELNKINNNFERDLSKINSRYNTQISKINKEHEEVITIYDNSISVASEHIESGFDKLGQTYIDNLDDRLVGLLSDANSSLTKKENDIRKIELEISNENKLIQDQLRKIDVDQSKAIDQAQLLSEKKLLELESDADKKREVEKQNLDKKVNHKKYIDGEVIFWVILISLPLYSFLLGLFLVLSYEYQWIDYGVSNKDISIGSFFGLYASILIMAVIVIIALFSMRIGDKILSFLFGLLMVALYFYLSYLGYSLADKLNINYFFIFIIYMVILLPIVIFLWHLRSEQKKVKSHYLKSHDLIVNEIDGNLRRDKQHIVNLLETEKKDILLNFNKIRDSIKSESNKKLKELNSALNDAAKILKKSKSDFIELLCKLRKDIDDEKQIRINAYNSQIDSLEKDKNISTKALESKKSKEEYQVYFTLEYAKSHHREQLNIHASCREQNLAKLLKDRDKKESQCKGQVSSLKEERDSKLQLKHKNFMSAFESLNQESANLARSLSNIYFKWNSKQWEKFKFNNLNHFVPIGKLKRTHQDHALSVACVLQFVDSTPLIFKLIHAPNPTQLAQVQNFLLRLLTGTIPAGKFKCLLIDPIGRGQNVAPFLHLKDYKLDESSNETLLIGSRAWTEERDIQKQLEDLTRHIDDVSQEYLRNQFKTIEEFNESAGEVTEPYRIVVIMDFPAGFNKESAQRLLSIVQSGVRCGVYAIIVTNPAYPMPHDFNLQDLEQLCTVLECNKNGFVWPDPDFKDCELTLDMPPETTLFNQIIEKVGQAAVAAHKQVEVPFAKVLERSQLTQAQWWSGNTAEKIEIPLGPIGASKIQSLELGKGTAQHVLTAGKTGSGKSTLLHVLITSLALRYSPDEIQLYLIDFKKGVEFKRYAVNRLPHARVIAIESEREFGLSVLEGLDTELKRRGDLFRNAEVDGLKAYRQKQTEAMPRILLLVDEFQEFFTESDNIASKAGQIMDRLVRQGRAFGIHLILGSQTLGGAYALARTTVDQMAVRIALQCSEQDSRLILHDDNNAARRLSRPGQAIYNAVNGLTEGNSPFQVAWVSDEQHTDYLRAIQDLAKQQDCFPPAFQIIFEGNKPVEMEQHEGLKRLLTQTAQASNTKPMLAWLGDPVAIKEITAIHFRRQTANNVLIVGQEADAAMSIFITMSLSLSAQHSTQTAQFFAIDFSEANSTYAEYWQILSQSQRHNFNLGRQRKFAEIIQMVYTELEQRLEQVDELGALKDKPTVYLMIYGIQRARDLDQDAYRDYGSFGQEEKTTPSPAKQFAQILKEGSDLGIYTVLWCDTVSNMNRRLERQMIKEFDLRILFQMSKEDASPLLDAPAAAAKLGAHRALLYDMQEGTLEKFRPFALPNNEWLFTHLSVS